MTPVPLARVSPAGSDRADTVQESGAVPPDPARVVEYGAPTVALGKELVVIEGAAATAMDSTLVVEAPMPSVS